VCFFFLKFLTWGRPTHDTHHIKTTRQENSWRITTLTVSQLIVIANLGAWRIRTSVNQRGPMAQETGTEWQASKWLKLIFTFHLGVSSPSGHQLAQSTGCRWPFVHVNVLLRRRPWCVPCSTHTHTQSTPLFLHSLNSSPFFFLSFLYLNCAVVSQEMLSEKGTRWWWWRRTGRLRDDERSGRETTRD
jgi:hypothetical protein